MRVAIGVVVLGMLSFSGFWPVVILVAPFFASAVFGYFLPNSKFAVPGVTLAMALGSLVVLVFVICGLWELFDHDDC